MLDVHVSVRKLNAQCFDSVQKLKEILHISMTGVLFFVLAGTMMYPSKDSANANAAPTSEGNAVFGDDGGTDSGDGNLWSRVMQARPSLIPSLCTHFTRAGIEWRR